jgi:hypothetical protein
VGPRADGLSGNRTPTVLSVSSHFVDVPLGSYDRLEYRTGPPSLQSEGYRGLFPRNESGHSVKLTTHLHLVPRLRRRAISPHSLCVFMARSLGVRTALHFTFYNNIHVLPIQTRYVRVSLITNFTELLLKLLNGTMKLSEERPDFSCYFESTRKFLCQFRRSSYNYKGGSTVKRLRTTTGYVCGAITMNHLNLSHMHHTKSPSDGCLFRGIQTDYFRNIQVEVFSVVTPRIVVLRYQRFGGPCCLRPEYGNFSLLPQHHAASQPRRPRLETSPP